MRDGADPYSAIDETERIIRHFEAGQDEVSSVEWTGVYRFSHFARQHIRADIERITAFVILAIFSLYLIAFRSVSYRHGIR